MQIDRPLRMKPVLSELDVGPDLAVPSRSLGEGWRPGHGSFGKGSADSSVRENLQQRRPYRY